MKQKFIEWFTKNNNGCSPAMEDDRSFVHEKTQHMFEAYLAGVAEGEAKCAALAAENAGLKESRKNLAEFIHEELDAGYPLNMSIETPSTDAFLAEVRAQESAPLVRALTVIANSEQHDGETVACDFDTLISVAAGALKDHYAAQLRKGVPS